MLTQTDLIQHLSDINSERYLDRSVLYKWKKYHKQLLLFWSSLEPERPFDRDLDLSFVPQKDRDDFSKDLCRSGAIRVRDNTYAFWHFAECKSLKKLRNYIWPQTIDSDTRLFISLTAIAVVGAIIAGIVLYLLFG